MKDAPFLIRNENDARYWHAYDWGLALDKMFPEVCGTDFAYAVFYNSDCGVDLSIITDMRCTQVGYNDAEDWIWEVTTPNGAWRFQGGCDYTGWDCQSDLRAEVLS